jgi:hypothetical protein
MVSLALSVQNSLFGPAWPPTAWERDAAARPAAKSRGRELSGACFAPAGRRHRRSPTPENPVRKVDAEIRAAIRNEFHRTIKTPPSETRANPASAGIGYVSGQRGRCRSHKPEPLDESNDIACVILVPIRVERCARIPVPSGVRHHYVVFTLRERVPKESSRLRSRSIHGVKPAGACTHRFSDSGC